MDFNDCAAPGCKRVYFCCKVNMGASEVAAGREQEAREEEVQGSTTWPSPGRDKGVDHRDASIPNMIPSSPTRCQVRKEEQTGREKLREMTVMYVHFSFLFVPPNKPTHSRNNPAETTSFINCVR